MQTAETRHLAKREKKYLEKPDGRRHLKAAVTQSAKEFESPASRKNSKEFADRGRICMRLRKGKRRAD